MLFRISVSLVHSSSGLHWPDNSESIFRAAAQWRTRSQQAAILGKMKTERLHSGFLKTLLKRFLGGTISQVNGGREGVKGNSEGSRREGRNNNTSHRRRREVGRRAEGTGILLWL